MVVQFSTPYKTQIFHCLSNHNLTIWKHKWYSIYQKPWLLHSKIKPIVNFPKGSNALAAIHNLVVVNFHQPCLPKNQYPTIYSKTKRGAGHHNLLPVFNIVFQKIDLNSETKQTSAHSPKQLNHP